MGLKVRAFVPPDIEKFGERVTITDRDFHAISDLIYNLVGISLGDGKKVLVESRLAKRLRDLKMNDFRQYLAYLEMNAQEQQVFINALTTNKTDFFREERHFQILSNEVFPALTKRQQPYVNIWSAASSTGEEVYTLAIVASEYFENSRTDVRILGTDIDTQVLSRAQKGIYPVASVQTIKNPLYVHKYFERQQEGRSGGGCYQVVADLRNKIKFRQFNLIKDQIPVRILFDVIFLRNVLIYFDHETIQKVISKMSDYLAPGGHLFIGHSETLNGIQHPLKNVSSSVYKKV